MDAMDEIRQIFLAECEEHLAALGDGLARLAADPNDAETIDTVFRAVHSVKGGAAAFAMADLVGFAHGFESTLDALRGGRVPLGPALLAALTRAADLLADLLAAGRGGAAVDPARTTAELARLAALQADEARWRIRFRPFPTLFERGSEPAVLLRELGRLGRVETTCNLALVPRLDDVDPEGACLSWTVEIATAAPEAALREVFEFAEDDCALEIERIAAAAPAPLPESAPVAATPAPAAPEAPAPATAAAAPASPTVRVDLARVDRLINLVGELVIAQATLAQAGAEAGPQAVSGLDALRQLTRDIQDSVLAIRAQPVKPLFQRMARIVREAAASTGKRVAFETAGELTELDKTVIERLADPLTHMVRNAIDHGLESPERRRTAGKPETGTVRLSAEHRSGRVLIEIADDGAGIDRARVRQIAVARGLIAAESVLSEAETDALLFLPGFSTASAVSDLSGRGVGMDVVKRAIVALGGRIAIASQTGKGTSFGISLPLTLAILDGMVVSVGGETLVVPLAAILEVMKPRPALLQRVGRNALVVQRRGELVPVVDVGARLGFLGLAPGEGVMLLIETSDGERRALAVDAIREQRQVVIKGLAEGCGAAPGVAAATILGNGRVALILDPDALATDGARFGAPGRALAG